jgi:hypothetical protein
MNAAHVSLLAQTELRRRYRSLRADGRRFVVLVIAGVFMLLPLALVVFGLFAFGAATADGSLPVSMAAVRGGGGVLVIGVAVLNAIRTVQTAAVPANADGVLTMADHSEVVASILLVETLAGAGIVLVPGILGAIAFGVGAGSAVAALGFLLAVVCAVALGSVLGIAAGFVVRNALARSETLARYRTPAAIALFLAYMYVIVAADFESAFEPLVGGVASTPLGWFGDLALAPVSGEAVLALAGGAVLLAVAGVAVLAIAVDRLAGLLWYVEAVEGSTGETDSSGMGGLSGVPIPVARVARKSWLRAWRSPIRLLYVVYPLFFVIAPISDAVRTGVVPPYLAGVVALYLAWATGAAFTLNPIGDEGDVLPITLTSPISGREFVAGCCLAGAIVGLPLSVVGTLLAAVFAGSPVSVAAGAVALAVILPVAATGIAAGVGVTLPRFEPVNVTRGRQAVIPSLLGFGVYSIAFVVAASPGMVVQLGAVRDALAGGGMSTVGVLAAGVGGTALLSGALAALGYWHAVRTFDSYYPG